MTATPTVLPPLTRMPRAIIEATIDALIAELDRRDGDPDLEDNGDSEHDVADVEHVTWANRRTAEMHNA